MAGIQVQFTLRQWELLALCGGCSFWICSICVLGRQRARFWLSRGGYKILAAQVVSNFCVRTQCFRNALAIVGSRHVGRARGLAGPG